LAFGAIAEDRSQVQGVVRLRPSSSWSSWFGHPKAPGTDFHLLSTSGAPVKFATLEKNELVLDVKKEVLGLTLHPGFEKNGYVFIASLTVAADAQPRTVRVSRFKVDQGESPRSDAKSELVLALMTSWSRICISARWAAWVGDVNRPRSSAASEAEV